jgi:prepilin-type N-terminal cleavage/methylation domain-containing protein
MILNKNIKQMGFTIVELLIVIVVIGILAAITIVAYNGIQNRGKTSAAQSAAVSAQKKAEIYNTDGPTGTYPVSLATLTGAAATTSYQLTGVTASGTITTAPAAPATITYLVCGVTANSISATTAPTQAQLFTGSGASSVVVGQITGAKIQNWNYSTNAIDTEDLAGTTSGTFTQNSVNKSVACFVNN